MSTIGLVFLVIAFATALAAALLLFVGHFTKKGALARIGRAGVAASALALLGCCAVLVFCFMTGDCSIRYVLEQRSLSTDGLAWLYRLSGLWAGRSGSLLFWTFLIALLNAVVLARSQFVKGAGEQVSDALRLDNVAMAIVSVVVAVFCGVLLFSDGNMPFEATPSNYFTADGELSCLLVRDYALVGGYDGDTKATQHLRDVLRTGVDT